MSRSDNSRRGTRSRFDDHRAAGRAARDREADAVAVESINLGIAATPRRDGECPRCAWITGLAACPVCGFNSDDLPSID